MRDYLERLKGAIQIERLSGYAPELNPVEYVWGMSLIVVDGPGGSDSNFLSQLRSPTNRAAVVNQKLIDGKQQNIFDLSSALSCSQSQQLTHQPASVCSLRKGRPRMPGSHTTSTTAPYSGDRAAQLSYEISYAAKNTNPSDLWACGFAVVPNLGKTVGRRCLSLMNTVQTISEFTGREVVGLSHAYRHDDTRRHIASRAEKAMTMATAQAAMALRFTGNLINNPREIAPPVILGALSFYLGSGGPDGDGGIPDEDLIFGLGAHRSIFTHSILAGATIETLAILALDLLRAVHVNLPPVHDKLWDDINSQGTNAAEIFTRYVSAGITHHLIVDATIDGDGTYKDFPVPMPIEGHQAVAGLNAAAEGADAYTIQERMHQGSSPDLSTTYYSRAEARAAAKRHPGYKVEFLSEEQGYRLVRSS